MNLNIVRNFIVGMTPPQSRIGDVTRGCDTLHELHKPRLGWVQLGLRYMPDKAIPREVLVAVMVREEADEKYVAKQFVQLIKDNLS